MSEPGADAGPLAGRRIVITRAADQAAPLEARLRALGADPIVLALIEIVDAGDSGAALAAAVCRLGHYDWLAVTSPNGASRVRRAVAASRSAGTPVWPKVAVVGTATAAALGVTADLSPRTQTAAGLVAELPSGPGTVLVVQAEGAEPTLVDGLLDKGWVVDSVIAYKTVPRRPDEGALLEVLAADAVLFASGSAVRAWTQVFGTSTPASVFAIGPATAQVATNLGLKVDVVATDHSLDGLVSSAVTYWSISD